MQTLRLQLVGLALTVLVTGHARAQFAVPSPGLELILGQIRDGQNDEFDRNTERWSKVADLLDSYIQFSQAEQARHQQWQRNGSLLSTAERDHFKNGYFDPVIRQMRNMQGTDLSSKAIASGLSPVPVIPALSDLGRVLSNFVSADSSQLIQLIGAGTFLNGSAGIDTSALNSALTLFNQDDINTMIATLGLNPNTSSAAVQQMRSVLERNKLGADNALSDLTHVRTVATDSAKRLDAIQSLLEKVAGLATPGPDGTAAAFDAGKLAELRAYLTTITALQSEAQVLLQAKEQASDAAQAVMGASARGAALKKMTGQ